jgi:hypothetical protein
MPCGLMPTVIAVPAVFVAVGIGITLAPFAT